MKKPIARTARKAATKTASAKSAARKTPAKNILAAGIKALSNVHEEALARQSRVFESILGLPAKAETPAKTAPSTSALATALDPFGFRKFEDVFDQRVARSLEHLGVPSPQAFADLTSEVERLRALVARLEARLAPPGSKKR